MYRDKINNEHELNKNAEQDIKEIEYLLYHYNELKNIVNNSSDIKHLVEQLKAKRYNFKFADDDVLDVFMDYCIVYTITSFENKLEISEFVEWIDKTSFIHSNWNIDNYKQELERLKELFEYKTEHMETIRTKHRVYTIMYGYVDKDGSYECTNEESFLTKEEYESALKEILASTINNKSEDGFWVECYCDIESLTEEDLADIKDCNSMVEPKKATMIQYFIIKNTLCSAETTSENKKHYALNDFKVGDVAFDTALAEIRDKKFFDEFGNFIKEIE